MSDKLSVITYGMLLTFLSVHGVLRGNQGSADGERFSKLLFQW